jgi:hypothetical protein
MAMLTDLIKAKVPTDPRRIKGAGGGIEHHLTEGAVMVAFAIHLFKEMPGIQHVRLCPDGEHGKLFQFRHWLEGQGFVHIPPKSRKKRKPEDPSGTYCLGARIVELSYRAGVGDVVAIDEGRPVLVAECKGG